MNWEHNCFMHVHIPKKLMVFFTIFFLKTLMENFVSNYYSVAEIVSKNRDYVWEKKQTRAYYL